MEIIKKGATQIGIELVTLLRDKIVPHQFDSKYVYVKDRPKQHIFDHIFIWSKSVP